jgi:hypothetical protein
MVGTLETVEILETETAEIPETTIKIALKGMDRIQTTIVESTEVLLNS